MVTREVSCRHEIDSFKIEVICHIMGNSKLGKTLQLVTIRKVSFFFHVFISCGGRGGVRATWSTHENVYTAPDILKVL